MKKLFVPLSVGAALAAMPVQAAVLHVGEEIQGFKVVSVTPLPEMNGRLWRLTYLKNGADLAWLDREDDNKTFGISFRTLPEDSTGVAHILEHSVLCGSEKYPVKEPFVDLLKSSLYTFLNAFTSKDQTVYPVSSRNDRDFLNLTSVYLDAVFHPLSVHTPEAFAQEGWHWEMGKDGVPERNGVVLNEMKGVYANPESVGFREMVRLLYPDTVYRHDSGGAPDVIPSLTYPAYVAFYKRFYHPSNARIFLDGRVDISSTLALLDSYLAPYPAAPVAPPIAAQAPVTGEKTLSYPLPPKEDAANRTLLFDAVSYGDYDEIDKVVAMDILADALAGSNEMPLKKALLEKKLCEDVSLFTFGWRQLAASVFVKNVKDGAVDDVRRVVRETLRQVAEKGLDHARLAALLDKCEFLTREKFSGGGTRGVGFMNDALDQWLYGGDPAAAFQRTAVFARLRAGLATGWWEKLLLSALVENPHRVRVTLTPSTTLRAERAAADLAARKAYYAGLDEKGKAALAAETRRLDAFRTKEDSPEDRAKLPTLPLQDIPEKGTPLVWSTEDAHGLPVVRAAVGAQGVYYLKLAFKLDDLTDDEVDALPVLETLLGEMATSAYSAAALQTAKDAGLGNFSVSAISSSRTRNRTDATPVFVVTVAGLENKWPDALKLVPEILLRTRFEDTAARTDLIRQRKLDFERAASSIEGRMLARSHAAAPFSAKAALADRLGGIACLRHIQALDKAGVDVAKLEALVRKVFTRAHLTVFLSDNLTVRQAEEMAAAFPKGSRGGTLVRKVPARQREGITIPGESAYAAYASSLGLVGGTRTGGALVAARCLSLDYLWNEIRVKGGAYGGGLSVDEEGGINFLSWRDPQPARSLATYRAAVGALRAFVKKESSLDRYIVGTLTQVDPCLSPGEKLKAVCTCVLNGRTDDDRQQLRREVLAATKTDLEAFADRLESLEKQTSICVLGGEGPMASCTNQLDRVETLR